MLGKLQIYVIFHLLTFTPTKSHVIPIFICFHPFSTWVSWDFYQAILPSNISSVSMDCSCDIGTVAAESKATPGKSWAWGKPSRCSFWEYIVCKIHVYIYICMCIHVYLDVYVYIYVNINEYIYMCVTRNTAFRRPWVFCDQRCIMGDF